MADNLDAFLKGAPEDVPEAPPAPEPETQQAAPETPPEAPEPEAPPEPEAEAEQQDGRHVPLRALEAERKQRQDWKEQAIRAQAERDALAKQLEEARKPPPQVAQQPQEPPPVIDPRVDPEGFWAEQDRRAVIQKLNVSEMLLRSKVGAETVKRVQDQFQKAAEANPALYAELYRQPDPYAWAHEQVEAMQFREEIGGDPKAYREKLRAELLAELQAAQPAAPVAAAPPPRPAIPQTPSLARVNSAAPRSATPFTGPPPIGDILGRR